MLACLEGVQVVATETVVSEIDIFASSTSNFNIVSLDRTKKDKYNPIVGNIGHFDNEIDLIGLEGLEGMKVDNIKPEKIVSSSQFVTVQSCGTSAHGPQGWDSRVG